METYAKKIGLRLRWTAVLLIAVVVMVRVLMFVPYYGVQVRFADVTQEGEAVLSEAEPFDFFVMGFATGLLAVFVAMTAMQIVRYWRALRSPERLKQLYIREHDERVAFIKSRVSAATCWFIPVALIVAVFVTAWCKMIPVTLTLMGVLVLMSLTMIALKTYFSKKV